MPATHASTYRDALRGQKPRFFTSSPIVRAAILRRSLRGVDSPFDRGPLSSPCRREGAMRGQAPYPALIPRPYGPWQPKRATAHTATNLVLLVIHHCCDSGSCWIPRGSMPARASGELVHLPRDPRWFGPVRLSGPYVISSEVRARWSLPVVQLPTTVGRRKCPPALPIKTPYPGFSGLRVFLW